MEAVVPLRFKKPPLTVMRPAVPPTVNVPPLSPPVVAVPATVTLPADTLPLKLRLLANRVLPAPARVPTVIVPLVPLKRRLFASVLALLTVPNVPPLPENEAVALLAPSVTLAPDLKSTPAKEPELTKSVPEPERAPAPANSVPPVTLVEPL